MKLFQHIFAKKFKPIHMNKYWPWFCEHCNRYYHHRGKYKHYKSMKHINVIKNIIIKKL